MSTTTRTATWSAIGTNVRSASTIEDVLSLAKLDFEVSKQPLFTTVGENRILIPDQKVTVIDDQLKVLGIVSSKYQICQNRDAFDFVNCLSKEVTFVKAGMTNSGMVYIIAELPEVKILGDSFKPHVIFSNGFNGSYAVRAAICPLRIICQNQFALSFRNTNNSVTIRHTSTMNSRMAAAKQVLTTAAEYMDNMAEVAKKWAKTGFTQDDLETVVKQLFPEKENMSQCQVERREEQIKAILAAYNSQDNQNFKGSLWGAVNAMTDYVTHASPLRKTENIIESKFMSVTFDPKLLSQFVTMALSQVA